MNRPGLFMPSRSPFFVSRVTRLLLALVALAFLMMIAGCSDEEPAKILEPDPVSLNRTTIEDLVDSFVDAHARGDLDAYAECLHPDFTFRLGKESIPRSWTVDCLDRVADLKVMRTAFDSLTILLDFPDAATAAESRSWTGFYAKGPGDSPVSGSWSTFAADVGFSREAGDVLGQWANGEVDLYFLPDPEHADLWTLWKIRDRTQMWTRMKTAFEQPEMDAPDTTDSDSPADPGDVTDGDLPDDEGEDAPADSTDTDDPADDGVDEIHRILRSDLARNLHPDESGLAELIRGNHEFAVDLYARLIEDGENLLFSPFSIRAAFAMVYAGARGETAAQMAEVLGYPDDASFHPAFNALDLALRSRNRPADDQASELELYVDNAFWGRKGFAFLKDYLDLLAVHYGSEVHELDFEHAPEPSRLLINEWVEDHTRDRIRDLLPQGSIDSGTAAILTNTLYLKAPWECAFLEHATRPGRFLTPDGMVTPPMMLGEVIGGYTAGEGFEAAELPYRDWELGMVIILPDSGEFDVFESTLSADVLAGIMDGLDSHDFVVTLPRFTFESSFKLSGVLQKMGMTLPFMNCYPVGCADFSGMLDPEIAELYITEAFHKTFIAVDEKGTEAAAATAVVMGVTCSGPSFPSIWFDVNRSFIFLIRDIETGAILFLGRVLDPTAE